MIPRADATAAPLSHDAIPGVKFQPLTHGMWGELDRWLKQKVEDQALEFTRRQNLTREERQDYFLETQKLVMETSCSTQNGWKSLNTHEGFLKIMEIASGGTFDEEKQKKLMELVKDNEDDFESYISYVAMACVDKSFPETNVPGAAGAPENAETAEKKSSE